MKLQSFHHIKNILIHTSLNSKCIKRKVGCIIMYQQKLISTGCNKSILFNHYEYNNKKANYIACAEEICIFNLIKKCWLNLKIYIKKCTIYTTHFPCINCTRIIVQIGIKWLYFLYHYKYFFVQFCIFLKYKLFIYKML